MATETIDIIVRENGARVVKRRLEEIGGVAERSVRGLRLLQNSLFVLGGAGILAGLTRMLDTLTNFENRLVLVTRSTAELNAVQEELFDIAARTRSNFESTAEVYTRAALAVRQLGLSQRETLDFTESLNQATILSGASVREANAALIQLSQGLASGRLNGDELRSVLEQLPFVADVIADQLGITRGQLREFGREGKITSDIIIDAFANAREEIATKFAQTVPTVSQSFSVFRTELLRVLDKFDDFTGASSTVARAIIAIADSLEFLVGGVVAAGAAFAAWKLTGVIASLVVMVQRQRELAAAVASGNAVLLTSVEIERAKAASALQTASATAAAAAGKVRDIQLDVTQLQTQRALLLQQQASIRIDSQRRIARDALTGRFIAYNAAVAQNIRTNIALQRTETALLATKGQLATATAAQTAATNALTAAQGRAAAAGAAANTWTARLTRAFPGLAGAVGIAARALGGLGALIAANPIGAIVAAIVAAVAALAFFSDRITVTEDGVVTLRDVAIATFQLIGEAIAPVTNLISEGFATALNYVSGLWNRFKDFIGEIFMAILGFIKTWINTQIGLWVGLVNSIIKAWGILPEAIADLGRMAMNALITIVEEGIRGVLKAIDGLLTFIGSAAELVGAENPFAALVDPDALVDGLNLSQFRQELTGAAQEVGQIFNEEFGNALSTDYIGNAWSAILERARQIAEQRIADLNERGTRTDPPGTGDGAGGNRKTFEDVIRELTLQNELLRVNAAEREKLQAIIQIEEQLKRSLTETERALVMELLNENELLKAAADAYEEIRGPAYQYELQLRALNELLNSGRISQDEFTQSVLRARITFLNSQTDMASGLERGFLKILEKTGDFATQMEQIVTSAFDGMSQAIADLVVDGEADFSSLIRSINKQIVQLVVSQAFQTLFGGLGGGAAGGGGNIFSGLFQGLRGLLGFQNGGQFTVGANTGFAPIPNGGNDNRLVAFRAQDGEQVTVTPRNSRGRGDSGDGGTTQVIFNIQTPDVQSFKASQSQLAAQAARVIAQGRRNM